MMTLLERLMNSATFNAEGGGSGGGNEGGADDKGGNENKGTGDKGAGDKGGEKAFYADWTNEEAKGYVQTKGYKTTEDVAIALTHLNKLNKGSPNVVAWPQDENDEKAWADIYTRLGVPAEAKDYTIVVPDGVTVNDKFMEAAKGWFHEAKLSPKQAQFIADKWHGFVVEGVQQETQVSSANSEKELADYKAKVGAGWDESVVLGQRAVKALGLEASEMDKLDKAIGVPAVLNLMATLGRKIGGEANFLEGVGKDGFGQSVEEAKHEIAKLRGDKAFTDSLLDPRHPMHAVNTQKWDELQRKAFAKQ